MGIYDRDYYREEPRGFFLGGPRTMVINLVIINIAIYVVDELLLDGQLRDLMHLDPDLARKPWQAYQLLTHGFVHGSDPWHVGMNMLALWFFGRELEMLYGKREFLSLYLTLLVFAGACWVITENLLFNNYKVPAVGASGAVAGVAVLFGIHYPWRTIYIWGILPLPVWLLVAFYLLADLVSFRQSLRGDNVTNIAYSAHLAGAAYGAFYYRTRWTLGSLLPKGLALKMPKSRPKLRIHEPSESDQQLNDKVDKILEKIHREGEASLTAAERRTLEDASRRFQKRRS